MLKAVKTMGLAGVAAGIALAGAAVVGIVALTTAN